DGSTVAGVTTIIASATDDGTVTRVEFFVDGTSIGADENGADGWSVDWDTTGDVDGWHVLTAKATDDSNNTGESDGVGVLVDNIPTVLEIVRPTSGAPVSGQVEIALSGSPDLMWVEVYLDGEYLDKATLVDGVWTLLWDTTAFEDGVYTLTAYGMTKLEQGIESQAMQVTVQNTETPPGDEPTPTVPDVLPAMLCDLDDGSLNAHHCGRPVAIFRSGDELHLYGIDINTGNGSLALLVTAADIESAGVPEDVPVLIAVGENPYTHRPIALYRLPGGEFQLNTAYWDGKEYIVKWQPGAAHVEVIYW
ncbi:MAG TPA: Ig-like domain-containing protein, partial [Aggregatilineales bacterium]|nr:Ig-like domain-containing protein [Aggregatilineales bacterium]